MPPTITDMRRSQKSAADLLVRQLLSCILAVGLSGPLQAWGPEAHAAIGMLALSQLQPGARARLDRILAGPEGETMRAACNWPDAVREEEAWKWSARLHYVDLPRGAAAYSQPRDCPDRLCAAEAIKTYAKELANPAAGRRQRSRALAWLCHLVGDLHQPLHVGRRRDRGGNGVTVVFFGEPTNLHSVWDSGLIDREKLSFSEWAEFLLPVSEEEVERLQATSPLDWAMESKALREAVYDIGTGGLSWDYRYRSLPIVERRLREAGVRLAGLLNSVFAAQEMPPPAVTPGPGDSP